MTTRISMKHYGHNIYSCEKCGFTEEAFNFTQDKEGKLVCPVCKAKLPFCPFFTDSKESSEVKETWKLVGYCKEKRVSITAGVCKNCKIPVKEPKIKHIKLMGYGKKVN